MNAIDGMACAKPGCDNRGKLDLNIVGHGSLATKWGRRWRYRCKVCGGTVSTNTGTAYSGLHCAHREFDQVASLRVEGVSISARLCFVLCAKPLEKSERSWQEVDCLDRPTHKGVQP